MRVSDHLQQRQGDLDSEMHPGSVVHGDVVSKLAIHYRDRLLRETNLEALTELPPQTRRAKIEALVSAMIREEGRVLAYADKARLITFITNEAAGYGPLELLLGDPSITEIMVNAPDEIYVEQEGQLRRRMEISFRDEDHVRHIIDRIVSPLGRRIDESSPMVDARLRDGSRVNAIIPPLALNGPTLTIRRFRAKPFEIDDLIRSGTMSERMAAFLKSCVVAKLNILVSGGTGSGKTTTLNVLASFIPPRERIITIEDAAELQFYRLHPHVLRQEARPPNVEGTGEVTIRQLVRNALRMRPNRIVVGEVRGPEALDMLQAMNTGHEGSLTTVHANTPYDAFSRIETMVMSANTNLPSGAIREQMASALNIVIQQDRMPDGSRRITRVAEVQGLRKGQILLKDIFIFDMIGLDERGSVRGNHTPTGIRPKCLPRLKAHGVPVEDSLFVPDYLVAEMGEAMLADPDVTEIMINSRDEGRDGEAPQPPQVYVERRGRLEESTKIHFRDTHHLRNVIATIVAPLGRRIDEDTPMVDGRLPDGSRVNAVISPIALNGPVLTIRRFPRKPHSVDDLKRFDTLNAAMAIFLKGCVCARLNILVSGGTGSGKTTTLNVLSSFIPTHERIITIEDAAELRLQQPHVVRMEARPPDEDGQGEVTIRDLVRNSLRMRPDRIIVGEVRGAETLDMLQAMNTGHEGSLTTVHANSPQDAFSRLETMTMYAGTKLPAEAIRQQLASAIHIVIQQNRMMDGSRRMVSIAEVQGEDARGIVTKDIFVFEQAGLSPEGRVVGRYTATGVEPRCLARLRSFGVLLPPGIFTLKPPSDVVLSSA
jgi:pilus assembly protein CpaF